MVFAANKTMNGLRTDTTAIFQANNELDFSSGGFNLLDEGSKVLHSHIDYWSNLNPVIVPEFEAGLQWFNTSRPLTMTSDLRGKIIVFDFFTYGCITCQHVMQELNALEGLYSVEDGLVIIGIHSPKFDRQKEPNSLRNAVIRHGIMHPVMNDLDCKLRDALPVGSCPAALIVGPEGQIVFHFSGEGHRKELFLTVELMMNYFKVRGRLADHGLPIRPEKIICQSSSFLSYPGKICCSPDGLCLAVTDAGHNRILIASITGVVMDIIGCGERGFIDGDSRRAAFASPQGICWGRNNVLYVADTENHAIRKIDLFAGTVSTLAGNGLLGKDTEDGGRGSEQMLNSPWDVCLVPSQTASPDKPDVLLIAMAGSHQIWLLAVQDGVHWHKLDADLATSAGTCLRVYGSGAEEHRNNVYPSLAAFAQPSSLTFDPCSMRVYVADCSSSSIRVISLPQGHVKNIVGGSRDPKDLDIFGDVDGKDPVVRLQYPTALVYSQRLKKVFLADTYNNKIKVVNPDLRTSESVLNSENAHFNEPSGLCIAETDCKSTLYVADRNSHSIYSIDLETKTLNKIRLRYHPDLLIRNPMSILGAEIPGHDIVLGRALVSNAYEFNISPGILDNQYESQSNDTSRAGSSSQSPNTSPNALRSNQERQHLTERLADSVSPNFDVYLNCDDIFDFTIPCMGSLDDHRQQIIGTTQAVFHAIEAAYGDQITAWTTFMMSALNSDCWDVQPKISMERMLGVVSCNNADIAGRGEKFVSLLPGISDLKSAELRPVMAGWKWMAMVMIHISAFATETDLYITVGASDMRYGRYWHDIMWPKPFMLFFYKFCTFVRQIGLDPIERYLLIAIIMFEPGEGEDSPPIQILHRHYTDVLFDHLQRRCSRPSELTAICQRLECFLSLLKATRRIHRQYYYGGSSEQTPRDTIAASACVRAIQLRQLAK